MVLEANQAPEVMKIKEMLNPQETLIRESSHNKEEAPKEAKEVLEETEEVKFVVKIVNEKHQRNLVLFLLTKSKLTL